MSVVKKINLSISIALMGCVGPANSNASIGVDGVVQLCAGPIYKNQDLTGRDFSGRNLSCADFSGSILTRAKFDKANLYAANFMSSIGTGVSFQEAVLTDAIFKDATLRSSNFQSAILAKTIFDGATLSWSSFKNASGAGVSFATSIIQRVDFSGAQFSASDFTHADARYALYNQTRLDCANFSRADVNGVNFENANISGATFGGSHLTYATWKDGTVLTKIPDVAGLEILNNFLKNNENWKTFDYKIDAGIVSQGFYPANWNAIDGPEGKPFIYSDDKRWGIDYPDSSSVLALIFYPVSTINLSNASIKVGLRSRSIVEGGTTVQFFFKSTKGARFHLITMPFKVNASWQEFTIQLPLSKNYWLNSFNRHAGDAQEFSEAIQFVEEIGVSFIGFKNKPIGYLDMSNFSIMGVRESYPAAKCRAIQ